MNERIELIDPFGVGITILTSSVVLRFSRKIYGGTAQVLVPKGTTDATTDNIKQLNRIRIKRWNLATDQFESVFYGVIMSINDDDNSFTLGVESIFKVFDKRLTGVSEHITGQAGSEAQALLTAANAEKTTGITLGTENVTTAIDLTMNEETLFSAWKDIANASDSEFDITAEGAFVFLDRLGEDKTNDVTLYFKQGGQNRGNIDRPQVNIEGEKFVNRLIATGGGSTPPRVVLNDTVSQDEFGIITEKIRIDSARDLTTLTAMANDILDQRKNAFEEIEVKTIPLRNVINLNNETVQVGIDFFDVSLGDDVTVVIYDDFNQISESKRILAIDFSRNQNGSEEIKLSLSKTGIKRLALDEISDKAQKEELFSRIRTLESNL